MKDIELTGRVQKNYNITIPKKIRDLFHLTTGDFIKFFIVKDGILLKPKKLVDASQSYFWTEEWQKDELIAEEDIKDGKVSKTKNVKDLIKQLKK